MTPVSQPVVSRVESIQRARPKTLFFPRFHRGHESGIFARPSRIVNSRLHFSHIDGAQTQVANWNCIVSVRQSLFASFELHRVACLGWQKSFFEICACADQKT